VAGRAHSAARPPGWTPQRMVAMFVPFAVDGTTDVMV